MRLNKNLQRVIVFLIGAAILTLGVSLTVLSDIGAGSYDSINFALSDLLGINVSITIIGTSLIIVLLAAIIRREFPKFTTFITAIVMGVLTDMWIGILGGITVSTILSKVVIFLIGMLFVCLGIAIYLVPKLPANPTDDLMVSLTEARGMSIMKAKLTIDILCIVIAFLLKGPIGIGTIILTFGVGIGIDFFHNKIFKILNKINFLSIVKA